MKLFGFEVSRQKQISTLMPVDSSRGHWWPVVREPWPGAWQQNVEWRVEDVTAYFAVYACVTLIASDISKMRVKLVRWDETGEVWKETESPAFSPVLKKPNHYQNRIEFFQFWVTSKLLFGNTYVLKLRDERNVVIGLYVLDPNRVRVHVAPNGEVFYELLSDNLSRLERARSVFGNLIETQNIFVPASEIIHDKMNPLFHPLVGVSPIYACGLAALQGLKIQNNSYRFFANGSIPGGIITAPDEIGQEAADRIVDYWSTNFSGNNVGKVAVLGDGMTYTALTIKAADAQLIEQLKWTATVVCACFHVPPYMIGIAPAPAHGNIEAVNQQYYQQALQNLIEAIELHLDGGLGLLEAKEGVLYGTEMELDDLLRMDTASLVKTEVEKVKGTIGTPNESRKKLGLPPVEGGNAVMSQQQNFSLAALAERDAAQPFSKPQAAPQSTTRPALPAGGDAGSAAATRKALELFRSRFSDHWKKTHVA